MFVVCGGLHAATVCRLYLLRACQPQTVIHQPPPAAPTSPYPPEPACRVVHMYTAALSRPGHPPPVMTAEAIMLRSDTESPTALCIPVRNRRGAPGPADRVCDSCRPMIPGIFKDGTPRLEATSSHTPLTITVGRFDCYLQSVIPSPSAEALHRHCPTPRP